MKYAAETQVTEVCKNLNQNNYCYGNHCCSFWPDSRRMQQSLMPILANSTCSQVLLLTRWRWESVAIKLHRGRVQEQNKKWTFTAITKAILSTNNMPLFNHHWYWTLAADKQINWNIPVALVHVNALLGIRTCFFFLINQQLSIQNRKQDRRL